MSQSPSLAPSQSLSPTLSPTPPPSPTAASPPGPASRRINGVAVRGNQLVDSAGAEVHLHGVNRMGTEYACIQGWGIFDGPSTPAANAQTLDAMLAWNINAVRVPLNEDCWLGTKSGLSPAYAGANYRSAISAWVSAITGRGMVAILDLHWAAPNGVAAKGQQPMADKDNSPTFWASVASAYKSNANVIFDLFNEPYIERDPEVSNGGQPASLDRAWSIWRDGGTLRVHDANQNPTSATYTAAGMQDLVTAVRSAGARNPLMLGGLSYAQDVSQLRAHLPQDPLHQLVASLHPYPGTPCDWANPGCLRSQVDEVSPGMPLVSGELGRQDCTTTGMDSVLKLLDTYPGSAGYLAWVWSVTTSPCGNNHWDLITNYASGNPTVTGAGYRGHLQALPFH